MSVLDGLNKGFNNMLNIIKKTNVNEVSCDFEFFVFQTKPFKKNVKKYIIQDNKFTSEKVKNESIKIE